MPPARAPPPAMREPCRRSRPRCSRAREERGQRLGAVLPVGVDGRDVIGAGGPRRGRGRPSSPRRSRRCAAAARAAATACVAASASATAAVSSVLPSSTMIDPVQAGRRDCADDARDHARQVAGGVVGRHDHDQPHRAAPAGCRGDAGAGRRNRPRIAPGSRRRSPAASPRACGAGASRAGAPPWPPTGSAPRCRRSPGRRTPRR